MISVIIPFYNRKNTLSVCIDSVLNAKDDNVEVLLIDDGSNDGSGIIAKNYASKHDNVRYFYHPNSGVSFSRNVGIENAQGEWITFIDSDDVVLPNHFNIVCLDGRNADLLMVGAVSSEIDKVQNLRIDNGARIERNSAADYFMSKEFNPFDSIFYCVWDKFFKAEIINKNNLRFDETMSLGEDQSFVCDYLCCCGRLVRYLGKTYVCVNWNYSIEHLGRKLRTPESYLHNQIRGYHSLQKLSHYVNNNIAQQYAVNFGIDRPITRILYNYSKIQNRNLISRNILCKFLSKQVIPFLNSIDVCRFNARALNVRISRMILLKLGPNAAYIWAYLWVNYFSKIANPIDSYITVIIHKIKRKKLMFLSNKR